MSVASLDLKVLLAEWASEPFCFSCCRQESRLSTTLLPATLLEAARTFSRTRAWRRSLARMLEKSTPLLDRLFARTRGVPLRLLSEPMDPMEDRKRPVVFVR